MQNTLQALLPEATMPLADHYPKIRASMPYEQIEKRYPALLRAMRWAAVLSCTESADCIRALQERRLSGEAVNHFGGPLAVLDAAIRCRHLAHRH
jgi:hypothetical protein